MISDSDLFPPATNKFVELRAGPISLVFDDGSIRYLRIGEREIIRRIYAAIRDHQWRTIPGQIQDVQIERRDDSFRIKFVSEHNDGGIHFIWVGGIEGAANGTIEFTFEGTARSAFKRNRLGFCVLHPPESLAGAPCKVTHTDGSTSTPLVPSIVAPEQPVTGLKNLASLSYEALPRVWVTTEFFGDVFETEDQRNWTDDSFKTYCTPLALPMPVEVHPGDRVQQRIVVRVEGAPAGASMAPRATAAPIELTISNKDVEMPKIGFCATGAPLVFSASTRLLQLKPAHVRVESPMNIPDWQQPFSDGFREASALKCKVELALRLSGCPGEDLRDLITTYPEPFQHWAFTSSFARVLLSTFGEPSTSKRTLDAFRGFLLKTGLSTLDVPIGAGAEGDLCAFNSQRPPRDADLFFWSMNPQVHAFDEASISETPNGARAQVQSVQEYLGDAPRAVTPITLRPRNVITPNDAVTIDPRQKSLFGAVWTLGMVAALAEGGASSATFFETIGAKGLMENGGAVYPVYHVFRAVAGCARACVCQLTEPFTIAAIVVQIERGFRTIIGNYRRDGVEVRVPVGPAATIRRLNKETAAAALEEPDSFWCDDGVPFAADSIQLTANEIVFIDQPSLPDAF